ncbi:MAG: nucleoside-diphosphate kinase [Nitrospinae bacterium]|nr:nucleoside-diphosphate kinase [Nitrospinota bacterium]
MAHEHTLAIIKPDAVERGLTELIIKQLEEAGFTIVALDKVELTKAQAEAFYHVHRERSFFDSLTSYISSGPVVAMVLEKEGAILALRQLMGATDPAKAAPGTFRARWGESIERNVIHGSDGPETASEEVAFFFNELERKGRQ